MTDVYDYTTGTFIKELNFKEVPQRLDTIIIDDVEYTVWKRKFEKDERSFSQIKQYRPSLYIRRSE